MSPIPDPPSPGTKPDHPLVKTALAGQPEGRAMTAARQEIDQS